MTTDTQTKTTISVSKTLRITETFIFNKELSKEQLDNLFRGNIPNFDNLEEQADTIYEEETDSSNKWGYEIDYHISNPND